MTTRTAELLMGIATYLLTIGLMWNIYADGLSIGWVEGRGPGSGMWPFWLALGMALAATATLIRWFLGATPESRSLQAYVDPDTMFLVAISAGALLAWDAESDTVIVIDVPRGVLVAVMGAA